MSKNKRYILLISLTGFFLFNFFNVAYGGEAVKYDNFNISPTALCYFSPVIYSKQNNQNVPKVIIISTDMGLNSVSLAKYNTSGQVVATTTSSFINKGFAYNLGGFNMYYFEFYPNFNLNTNEYFAITDNNTGLHPCLSGGNSTDNGDVFNRQYFTTDGSNLMQIYVLSPDNPQVYQFYPNNVSYGSNFLSVNFTSSTPLTFYVANTNNIYLNFYVKDKLRSNFDYQFKIEIPDLYLTSTTHLVKINFKDKIVQVINTQGTFTYDFKQSIYANYTNFQDNAYYGNVSLKIEALNIFNNLTGSGIANYTFPNLTGSVSEEALGLFFYNADNNDFLTPFFDCGSPSNSSSSPEIYNANRLKIEVFSCGLISGQSYQLRFALVNITDDDVIFQDINNFLTGDFNYSHIFTLENNKLYKVIYNLYRGGVLVYDREVYFRVNQITSPVITYNKFYQSKIGGFGLPTSTTPTPAFASFGSLIDKIFNPVSLFLIPDKSKINNLKTSIIDNINNFIGYISGFNSQLGYFSVLFYGLIIFIVIEVVVKMYKLLSPFK
jgi:hypothetical protein